MCTYTHAHTCMSIPTKNTTDISERQAGTPTIQGRQTFRCELIQLLAEGSTHITSWECFYRQLERKEPINNIKQARPHHLIYTFLQLTLELPGVL